MRMINDILAFFVVNLWLFAFWVRYEDKYQYLPHIPEKWGKSWVAWRVTERRVIGIRLQVVMFTST